MINITFSVPTTKNLLVLALISALLMSGGWYFGFLSVGMFAGFSLILLIEKNISIETGKKKGKIFFGYVLLALFMWNVITTWWVWNASEVGAIAMLIANTLLMSIPFVLYRRTKAVLGEDKGLLSFIFYWIAFEYLHLNWDLSWSWLTLGNGFSYAHTWVQWYEYTGVLGGSVWVLLGNIIFFKLFTTNNQHNKKVFGMYATILIALPIGFSYMLYYNFDIDKKNNQNTAEIVVVQPNIDSYTEKFSDGNNFIPVQKQLQISKNLAQTQISPQTELTVFPETAVEVQVREQDLMIKRKMPAQKNDNQEVSFTPALDTLREIYKNYPQTAVLSGAITHEFYRTKATPTATAHAGAFYDSFNTALFFNDKADSVAIYHKSKLVPGVESMPYPAVFSILSKVMINIGGVSTGLARQKEREVFYQNKLKIAPVICYESIYGEFVGEYVKKGANMLCIITNDGWWGNTSGYKQHFAHTSLRAIETRKYVARSANTGISGFVDARGDVLFASNYDDRKAFKGTVYLNDIQTTYTKYGDYLGRLCAFLGAFLLISVIVKIIRK